MNHHLVCLDVLREKKKKKKKNLEKNNECPWRSIWISCERRQLV